LAILETSEVINTELNLADNDDILRNLNSATGLRDYVSDYFVKPNASLPRKNKYTFTLYK